jgi:hypothetical protein
MSESAPYERFSRLTYESFREMARDQRLSPNERSGFPDTYREGAVEAILADIEAKLPTLSQRGATVVDIGCGATPLTFAIRDLCAQRDHDLVLVDSPEVLGHHQASTRVQLLSGRFPDVPMLTDRWASKCDAVIVYSVIQYAFAEASVFDFVDQVLGLLRPRGRALLGDIPNASMRRRFLASAAGREHHHGYMRTDEDPEVRWPVLPTGEFDDAATLALLARARDAGFHAWLVPQAPELPMANRREDAVFERP